MNRAQPHGKGGRWLSGWTRPAGGQKLCWGLARGQLRAASSHTHRHRRRRLAVHAPWKDTCLLPDQLEEVPSKQLLQALLHGCVWVCLHMSLSGYVWTGSLGPDFPGAWSHTGGRALRLICPNSKDPQEQSTRVQSQSQAARVVYCRFEPGPPRTHCR